MFYSTFDLLVPVFCAEVISIYRVYCGLFIVINCQKPHMKKANYSGSLNVERLNPWAPGSSLHDGSWAGCRSVLEQLDLISADQWLCTSRFALVLTEPVEIVYHIHYQLHTTGHAGAVPKHLRRLKRRERLLASEQHLTFSSTCSDLCVLPSEIFSFTLNISGFSQQMNINKGALAALYYKHAAQNGFHLSEPIKAELFSLKGTCYGTLWRLRPPKWRNWQKNM